jgi:hypothetical protein
VYGEKREQRRSNRQEVTRRSARSMWRVASKASGGWCAGSSSSPTSTPGTGCLSTWTSGQSLTAEAHLAPSTIRGYQTELRSFNEYLCDARYGWVVECQKQFGEFVAPASLTPHRGMRTLRSPPRTSHPRPEWPTAMSELPDHRPRQPRSLAQLRWTSPRRHPNTRRPHLRNPPSIGGRGLLDLR